MPFIKILRKLPVFVCYLLLAITLSGCSAIGTNKPAALQVSTVPEASIFLDGKHLGKTPFYSDQLKAGTHTLKIAASEANYVAQIDLRESTLTVINRQLATNYLAQAGEILTLEPAKSGFLVLSSPSGASLVVDGKLQGQTPALVENIAEGEHKVEISKEGYLQRQFAIKIAKNYQLQAQVTLASEVARGPIPTPTPAVQVVKIEITATPQGFLRVRRDASLNSPEIGRVKPTEQYELIQESNGWVKISFDGKQGWISNQYTKKL